MKHLKHKFSLFLLSVSIFTGCSSMESSGIKEWLKEGTREYQVEDEEVRVCYVAVTRAKNDLFLLDIPHNRSKPFPLLKHHDKL